MFREGCWLEGAYRRGRMAKEREFWVGKGVQHVSGPHCRWPVSLCSTKWWNIQIARRR